MSTTKDKDGKRNIDAAHSTPNADEEHSLDSSTQHPPGPSPAVSALFIALVGTFATIAYSVIQWRSYAVPSWDLGIFTELAKKYAHLESPIVDIKGPGYNLLGDHFHPLLVVLTPFFAIFPSGLTLLIVQNVLFAASSIPVTMLAIDKLGTGRGITIGASYMFSWGLLSAVTVQFHEIALAVPLLAYGLTRWIASEGHSRSALVAIGLLVFVKEDLGLTVAAIGAVIIWQAWGRASLKADIGLRTYASLREALHSPRAKIGFWLIVWGMVWMIVAIVIVLPAFNPEGAWEYTNRLGESDSAASNILLRFFTPPIKYATLSLLALAAGLIGCLSPYMWIMIPTLTWRFLGNTEHYWGWGWHYSAILMPVAAVALIDATSRWKGKEIVRTASTGVALLTSLIVSWPSFFQPLIDGRTPYSLEANDIEAANEALEALGSGHNVVANLQFLAYAVPNNTVFWEGNAESAPIDAVILGNQSYASRSHREADRWAAEKYGGTWRIVYSKRGFQVAMKE